MNPVTTVDPVGECRTARARSLVFLFLGRVLSARNETDHAWIMDLLPGLPAAAEEGFEGVAMEEDSGGSRVERSPGGGAELRRAARDLAEALRSTPPGELAGLRHGILGPIPESGTSPHETAYAKGDAFATSHLLADLSGFYRAFGVEPGGDRRERPDHVAVQLEFLAFLCAKEALSLSRASGDAGPAGGEPDDLDPPRTCWDHTEMARQAARSFWLAHTGRFAPAFFARLAAAGGPYGVAGRFGSAVVEAARRFWS